MDKNTHKSKDVVETGDSQNFAQLPCSALRFSVGQKKEFDMLTEPLKLWMRKNCDPYDIVIIDQYQAKLCGMELNNYNGVQYSQKNGFSGNKLISCPH